MDSLIKEYEAEEMEKRIYKLIPFNWHEDIKRYTEDEFIDTKIRDGTMVKGADDLAAYIEAYLAVANGILGVYAEHGSVVSSNSTSGEKPLETTVGAGEGLNLSTSSIAARLGSKTGPDLLMAAAAHLSLVKNKTKFSRQEISDEMKGAHSYYKSSMTHNLTKYLRNSVKDKRLNHIAGQEYALTESQRASLEARLAE